MNRVVKIAATLVALALLFALLVVPRMGTFLVVDHEPVEADAIVILMGSVPTRVLEAVELYDEGYADQIIVVHSYAEAEEILAARGVIYPGDAELTRMVAEELGVPGENISILPGQARSTKDEAAVIRAYLEEKSDINSLILVTSSFHTRRTFKIFERALNGLEREVNLIIQASSYDSFQAEAWWRDRQSAKMVVFEYLKLAYFYIWERWH
jgi:uncharacterized SAM-binding protein YcdF (DUF218 family)